MLTAVGYNSLPQENSDQPLVFQVTRLSSAHLKVLRGVQWPARRRPSGFIRQRWSCEFGVVPRQTATLPSSQRRTRLTWTCYRERRGPCLGIPSRSGRVFSSATANVALISVVPSLQCLIQKCPVLIIARALQRRVDANAQGSDTCPWRPLEFSSSKRSSRRPHLQCLLRLDRLWEMGIDSIWSGETASFFVLLLRGKIVAPKQGAAVHKNMLRDVGVDDSLPALDMENLPESAPQPIRAQERRS